MKQCASLRSHVPAVILIVLAVWSIGLWFQPLKAFASEPVTEEQTSDPAGGQAAVTSAPQASEGVTLTPQSATVIDLSTVSGDIEITSTGLVTGGTASRAATSAVYSYAGGVAQETSLNPDGYVFTGSSTNKTILIDPVDKPTTTITLDGITMTQTKYKSAIVTSLTNTTIVLQHGTKNVISSSGYLSNAFCIEKNGKDGKLTIKTDDGSNTGSLSVSALASHAGCIGSLVTDLDKGAKSPTASSDCSFTEFYFESGTLTARAGNSHNPGIGAGCRYYGKDLNGKETNGIYISGGVLDVTGGACCAGIGSGAGVPVNGITISGGAQVTARGGTCSPGIGSGGTDHWFIGADYSIKNITVTGGTTHVWAYGDAGTKIPGIGCGKDTLGRWVISRTITNVIASPIQPKWQGYCKYGTSATVYSFSVASPKTPFGTDGDIGSYLAGQAAKGVNVYYTEIYFGPYKDNNYVGTKAELGVNDTTRITGGSAWTVGDIEDLMLPVGHASSGTTLTHNDFTVDPVQFAAINAAKTAGRVGDWPLTYSYVDATEGTITVTGYVHLRDVGDGSSTAGDLAAIGADDAVHKTGGDAFTADEVKDLTKLRGSFSGGIHVGYGDVTITDGLDALNSAKTAGKIGDYPITYSFKDPDTGTTVTCTATVTLTTNGTETTALDELQAGSNDYSHDTGGDAWTSDQLRDLCAVVGRDSSGNIVTSSMTADATQLKAINDAKTAHETGTFPLTYSFTDSAGNIVTTTSEVTLTGDPVLSITLTTDKSKVVPRDDVTYTVEVVNSSAIASSKAGEVVFQVPDGMTVKDSDGGTVSADGKTITYSLNPLAYNGGSQTFTPVLTAATDATDETVYTNVATITKVGAESTNIVSDPATVTVEIERIDVSGTKTWVDANDQDEIRPSSVTLTLKADGVAVTPQPAPSWSMDSGTWTYTYTRLPKYTTSGTAIEYTVEEGSVEGYSVSYDTSHLNVTNTHAASVPMALQITKAISGRSFQAGDAFQFTMVPEEGNDSSGYSMPTDATVTTDATSGASQTVSFDKITFTKAGTYRFDISESSKAPTNITNSTDVSVATVTVTDDLVGHLSASVSYSGAGNDGSTFTNVYRTPETHVAVLPMTGDPIGASLAVALAAAGVLAMSIARRHDARS